MRHYSIDQSYLRKVPLYLIGWRLFVYNIVIYIRGGFQINILKDILLLVLHIFPLINKRESKKGADTSKFCLRTHLRNTPNQTPTHPLTHNTLLKNYSQLTLYPPTTVLCISTVYWLNPITGTSPYKPQGDSNKRSKGLINK